MTAQPDLAAYCSALEVSAHPELGRGPVGNLMERAQQAPSGEDGLRDLVLMRAELALELMTLGEFESAFNVLDETTALARDQASADKLTILQSIGHLRVAENENCLPQVDVDDAGVVRYRSVCLLNRGPLGVYGEQTHARQAINGLKLYLNNHADNMGVRWLLNLAAMSVGRYPEDVPERWRFPPEAFAAEQKTARFENVAPDLGMATVDLLGAGIADDFDGDGLIDVFTTTYDLCGHAQLFTNNGDGTFTNDSTRAGLDGQLGGFNAQQTDYDNDGDLDVFITRGAWQADFGAQRNSLLRNEGDGRFTDVTRAAGLAEPAMPTQASAWADYDLDGDLDLYVGNEESSRGYYPSQLFRNEGDGRFTDVAARAGVENLAMAKGVAWGDYDNDGDPDLYVSNVTANRLYRNDGDGTFTDVAPDLGVVDPVGRSFATWWFDYNNDGWLDLFVAGYETNVEQIALAYLGESAFGMRPKLYRNDGSGGFEDVTTRVGLDRLTLPMGANFGDIDNDGYLDIYLGTGDPDFMTLIPNMLLRNDGGERFYDVTTAAGLGHLQKGHGVSFADLDQDGDQDVHLQTGGFVYGDPGANALFENPGSGNHWITLVLEGSESNRSAIGARVTVTAAGPSGQSAVHREVTSGSSFGANSLQLETGLGDATSARRIEVRWPGGGTTAIEDVDVDQSIRIVEGADGYQVLDRPPFKLRRVDG